MNLKLLSGSASFLIAGAMLSACGGSGGGGAVEPAVTQANLTNNKLQLAVGVATFADGTRGLNVVSTFRQSTGNSATLVNTPTISGPFTNGAPAGASCPGSSFQAGLGGVAYLAGFAELTGAFAPAGAAGINANTNTISGSPQVPPGTGVPCSSLGEGGGVFAYGITLQNITTDQTPNVGAQFYYPQPLFSPQLQAQRLAPQLPRLQSLVPYLGGPPAYPNVRTGAYPAGFAGFSQGFLTFAIGAPPPGTYTLSVLVPAVNAASANFKATASINASAGLPAFPSAPVVTEDANKDGGLTVAFTPPPEVSECVVDIVDVGPNAASGKPPSGTAPIFYTIIARGSGPQIVALPPNLGPLAGGATTPSIAPGDDYIVQIIGADYPLFDAGPPANTQFAPVITGTSGQADLTFSPVGGNRSAAGY